MALVELSVVEQRYRAVLEAAAGVPVSEVAAHFGARGKVCMPGSAVSRAVAWVGWWNRPGTPDTAVWATTSRTACPHLWRD